MPEVTLLPFDRTKHTAFVSRLLGDHALMYGWGMEAITSETELQKWVSDPTRVNLIVTNKLTKEAVGYVNFYDWNQREQKADWGIVIDPKYKGQGYAQSAAKESIEYGFNVLGLIEIEIYIEGHNKVSQHIHEKVGYKYIRTDENKRRIYSIKRAATTETLYI